MIANEDLSSVRYLCGIAERYPTLTNEEEKALGQLSINGDEEARERLVLGNLKWVIAQAKSWTKDVRYEGHGDDLISAGLIGLVNCLNTYDGSIRLAVYSRQPIQWEIKRVADKLCHMANVPAQTAVAVRKVRAAYNTALEKHNSPTDEQIKAELFRPIKNAEFEAAMFVINVGVVPMDKGVNKDGDDVHYHDVMADTGAIDPSDCVTNSSYKELVNSLLEKATDKEKYVIERIYGLNGHEARDATAIGKDIDRSRQAISLHKLNFERRMADLPLGLPIRAAIEEAL